jgi:hypothetical protein
LFVLLLFILCDICCSWSFYCHLLRVDVNAVFFFMRTVVKLCSFRNAIVLITVFQITPAGYWGSTIFTSWQFKTLQIYIAASCTVKL